MLLRLAYLGITNAFGLLRLLPGSDRDKDMEILLLRHQLAVLQRQLDGRQVRFEPVDRAWLARVAGGAAAPAAVANTAGPAAAGPSRPDPQVAPRPDRRESRGGVPPQAARPTPYPALDAGDRDTWLVVRVGPTIIAAFTSRSLPVDSASMADPAPGSPLAHGEIWSMPVAARRSDGQTTGRRVAALVSSTRTGTGGVLVAGPVSRSGPGGDRHL